MRDAEPPRVRRADRQAAIWWERLGHTYISLQDLRAFYTWRRQSRRNQAAFDRLRLTGAALQSRVTP